ncbi:WD repeat-containing protein 86-like [Scylla paramamosain]|uniref:WD repeat-containing protein 86-like n=1 Tax=Scylla paramamosain TaxID=85552 RepID=UPI003083DEF5
MYRFSLLSPSITAFSACVQGHDRAVYPLMVDPGEEDETGTVGYGDLVVTGSLDCTARSWDFVSGNCLQVFKGHTGSVVAIVTDSDTRLLYTASADKTIRSWHIDTGVNFRVFEGHKSHITCLLALNKLLYSGDGDGVVRVWDLTARDALKLGPQHVVSVDSLASFRPATNTINAIKLHNGMLFIASSDNLARAVDAATREVLAVYTGHQIAVTCMAISGEHFYTGSTDTTLRVWDMPKRRAEGEESSSSNEEESEEGED